MDAVANISVGGRHIANWLIGQVRDETQTKENMAKYAREIGADETEFIKAFQEIQPMSREKFEKISLFLFNLAEHLSLKAYQNIQHIRFIQDKTMAEEKLKESEEKFRLIFENSPYVIAINRLSDGKYIDVNQKFEIETSISKSEALNKTSLDVVKMYDYNDINIIINELNQKGSLNQYLLKTLKKDGSLAYNFYSIFPITLKNEKCVVSIAVDISRQIEAEEALKKLNAELEQKVMLQTENLRLINKELSKAIEDLNNTQDQLIQSERLAALGQLVAGIAHELNTPLGAILSSSRSINEYVSVKFEKLLNFITSLSHSEINLFKLLLNECIKKTSSTIISVDRKTRKNIQSGLEDMGIHNSEFISSLISSTGAGLNFLKDISFFECNRYCDILSNTADIISIKVLTEIISNAAEKTSSVVGALKSYLQSDDSGANEIIDIEKEIDTVLTLFYNITKQGIIIEKKYCNNARVFACKNKLNQVWINLINNSIQAMNYKGIITIKTEIVEGRVKIHFTDSGPGVPQSLKDKIFEPFFTTKKRGEGIGLGLNICKQIIEKCSGSISLESEPGKTTFCVELPEKVLV